MKTRTVTASAIEHLARSMREWGGLGGHFWAPQLEQAISWPPEFIMPPNFLMPTTGRLPASRLLAGRIVQIHDDLPDLILRQSLFPRRHHRVPGRRFLRQPRSALRDPPEQIRFLEHRDGAGILEIRGRRIEALGEVTLTVEVVPVAVHAVADVRLAAGGNVLLEARLVLAEWILGARDVDRLAAELNGVRWCRVDRSQLGRRLRPRRGLGVGVVPEQQRNHDHERV